MRQYFVDTWYLVALFDSSDAHHAAAKRISRTLRDQWCVTHDGVLSEMLTAFADEGPRVRARAVELVNHILLRWEVTPADRMLFRRGLFLYAGRPDKEYSLVDCMSMQLMRDRGITHVLTNDHHFRQEGFQVVNDAP
jgi:predicted nucleic acid-binding protein